MAVEKKTDVQVIKSSGRDRGEDGRTRRVAHGSHDFEKGTRNTKRSSSDYHRNFEAKSLTRDREKHERRVVDKRPQDGDSKKDKVDSRVKIVRRQERDRLFVVTVKNDVSTRKGSDSGQEENSTSLKKESNKKAENGSVTKLARPESDEEASDVDSDYTIEMRSQKASDEDSVYSVEFTNVGGSEDECSDVEKQRNGSESVQKEDESPERFDSSEDADFERVDVDEEDDGGDSNAEDGELESDIKVADDDENMDDRESKECSNENSSDGQELIETAELHENITRVSSGRRTVTVQSISDGSAVIEENPAKISKPAKGMDLLGKTKKTKDEMASKEPKTEVTKEDVVRGSEVNQEKQISNRKLESTAENTVSKADSNEHHEEDRRKRKTSDLGHVKTPKDSGRAESKLHHAVSGKPMEVLLDDKIKKPREGKSKGDELVKGRSEEGETAGSNQKEGHSKDNKGLSSTSKKAELRDSKVEVNVRKESETNRSGKSIKDCNDETDKKAIQAKKSSALSSSSESKRAVDSARKEISDDVLKSSEKRTTERTASKAEVKKDGTKEEQKNEKAKTKSQNEKVTPKSYRTKETELKKSKLKDGEKTASKGGRNRRSRSKSSSDESSCSTCSGSGSSSSGSSSGSSRSDSESGRSSGSESESSSGSSQSGSSDSESSSSEEDNFKRRKRRVSERKSYDNDNRVKAKAGSPKKDRGRGYVSPLRTSKNDWGRRRESDDRSKQKQREPLGSRTNDSHKDSRGGYRDRRRYRSRSRSRDTGQRGRGQSRESERKQRYADSRGSASHRDRTYRYDRSGTDRKKTLSRQREDERMRHSSRDRKRTPERKTYDREKPRSEVGQRGKGAETIKDRGVNKKIESDSKEKEVKGGKDEVQKVKEQKRLPESRNAKSPERTENEPKDVTKVVTSEGKSAVVQDESSKSSPQKKEEKPKPLMEQKLAINSIGKSKELSDKVKDSTGTESGSKHDRSKSNAEKIYSKNSNTVKKTSDSAKQEENEKAPRPLMEITLENVKKPVSERLSRRVSVSEKSATNDGGKLLAKGHRRVTRVSEQSTEASQIRTVEKSRENQEAISEQLLGDTKTFLKRLSSGKSVMIERKEIEPLMKADDIEFGVVANSRIVQRKFDDRHHRSVRRVISNPGSDLSSAVVEVSAGDADDAPTPPKRKVFSRLGKSVISKSKNIAINLKPLPARRTPDKEVVTVKNEEEFELDARIKQIREKNEEILRRQREIEKDILMNS
eukprot:gene857-10606_t